MTKEAWVRAAVAVAALSGLSGCDDVRNALGLERHVPDETQVVARPPLTLPPEYALRPPGEATPVSQEHETGLSAAQLNGTTGDQALEKKEPTEEKGFFGRLFSGEIFGSSEPEDQSKVWRPSDSQQPPDANANAPAGTAGATPDQSTTQPANAPPPAAGADQSGTAPAGK